MHNDDVGGNKPTITILFIFFWWFERNQLADHNIILVVKFGVIV